MVVQMLGYKFSWVLSWVGVWKYQVQKKNSKDMLDPEKCWVQKKFGYQKIFGPEKFWVLKIFGPKKCWVLKNFGSWKILGPEKF